MVAFCLEVHDSEIHVVTMWMIVAGLRFTQELNPGERRQRRHGAAQFAAG